MITSTFLSSEWFGAAGRRARRLGPSLVLMAALAGCSVSVPIPGFVDATPTGSIQPKPVRLFDDEDWKIVEPKLRETLRADAAADPVDWSDSATGRDGRLIALAAPFKRQGEPCRGFLARIVEDDRSRTLQAVGCVQPGGEIAITDVAPWKGL